VLVRLGKNRKVNKATRSQGEEVKRVKQLAKEFATRVLKLKFSLAKIILFLLRYKQLPKEAINNVEI
jgi:hypothetical protein